MRWGGGGHAILGHVDIENPKMALENMALNSPEIKKNN